MSASPWEVLLLLLLIVGTFVKVGVGWLVVWLLLLSSFRIDAESDEISPTADASEVNPTSLVS